MLWIAESFVKYRAGFGEADILLVADGAASNSRIPFWFAPVESAMQTAPALLGFAIPLLESVLGVLLLLGLLTRWAAFASTGTLMLYWASDQLIAQYPVMAVLSATVLALPAANRFSADGRWRRHRDAARPRATSIG